ncbi:MAG: hypothetical protein J7L94_16160 [Caldisericaceae bacterium]|nr:hypothetical protein [Caldisericaceae bacterium]
MKKILVVLILLIAFFSCKMEKRTFIKKQDFASLSTKILLVHHTNLKKEQKWLVTKYLLERYEISSEEYTKTKNHFSQDPYFWEDVYRKMNAILEKAKPDSMVYLLRKR